jgi:hypothetical protein
MVHIKQLHTAVASPLLLQLLLQGGLQISGLGEHAPLQVHKAAAAGLVALQQHTHQSQDAM